MKTRLFRKGFFAHLIEHLEALDSRKTVILPRDRDETVELRPYVDFRVQEDE